MIAIAALGLLLAAPQEPATDRHRYLDAVRRIRELVSTSPEEAHAATEALLADQPGDAQQSVLQEAAAAFLKAGHWTIGRDYFRRWIAGLERVDVRRGRYALLAAGAKAAGKEAEWTAELRKAFDAGDRSEETVFSLLWVLPEDDPARRAVEEAADALGPDRDTGVDLQKLDADADARWTKSPTAGALREIGLSYGAARQLPRFRNWLAKTHDAAPSDVLRDAHIVALFSYGDPEGRLETLLGEARAAAPGRADLAIMTEKLLVRQGRPDAAARSLEEFLADHPNGDVALRLAALYRRLGRPADALTAVGRLAQEERTGSVERLTMMLHLEAGQDRRFEELFGAAFGESSPVDRLTAEIGLAAAAGRDDRIVAVLASFVESLPDDSVARGRYLLRAAGDLRLSGRYSVETLRDRIRTLRDATDDEHVLKALDDQIRLAERGIDSGPATKSELEKRKRVQLEGDRP